MTLRRMDTELEKSLAAAHDLFASGLEAAGWKSVEADKYSYGENGGKQTTFSRTWSNPLWNRKPSAGTAWQVPWSPVRGLAYIYSTYSLYVYVRFDSCFNQVLWSTSLQGMMKTTDDYILLRIPHPPFSWIRGKIILQSSSSSAMMTNGSRFVPLTEMKLVCGELDNYFRYAQVYVSLFGAKLVELPLDLVAFRIFHP